MEYGKTKLDQELDRIRRADSRRIMKARREGRLRDELEAMDREGRAAWKRLMGRPANGRARRKRA